MKKLMAAMLSFVMAMMLLAGCVSASTDNTFSDPMQQVSLSNDEMLTSLNNLVKKYRVWWQRFCSE